MMSEARKQHAPASEPLGAGLTGMPAQCRADDPQDVLPFTARRVGHDERVAEDGEQAAVVHWLPTGDDADARLIEVIALAKKHRQTLGFLPDTVFREAGLAGHLALAVNSGELVGYVLYRVTRSIIKLTHVCVDPRARGQQLGRLLIDHVVGAHPAATAVVARCRRDYGLERFWEAAGLSPSSEAAGRNAQGLPLTLWTRPLGAPDLLTASVLDSGRPIAVLDSNIVIDLYSSEQTTRPDRRASQELLADWLAEEVSFAVSVQLDHELHDNPDAAERVAQSAGSQGWVRLPTTRPRDTRLEDAILSGFGHEALAKDPSLLNDAKHLADAIRAGARYFVTNDGGVRDAADQIRDEHGIEVLRPHELISAVLAESGALQRYDAGVFEHIDLRWARPDDFTDEQLERSFMNFADREKAADFRPRLRESLARQSVKVLVDESGAALALTAQAVQDDSLSVTLLRVAARQHQGSIALQLARQLRADALRDGASSVTVTDPRLPKALRGALREDGYEAKGESTMSAIPFRHRLHSRSLSATLGGAVDLVPGHLDGAAYWRDLEWRHWPLRVWDDETPCYVVPIRPSAAMELFGYPPNLLQQKRALGLSRRHVYYRSGHSNPFQQMPARVLWYASKEGRTGVHQFFAVSNGVESHRIPAEEAHARYSGLGVYKKTQVAKAADKHGLVTVLEIEDTEILDRPIRLDEFRSRARPHGVRAEFVAPRLIPSVLFSTLMGEFSSTEVSQ